MVRWMSVMVITGWMWGKIGERQKSSVVCSRYHPCWGCDNPHTRQLFP